MYAADQLISVLDSRGRNGSSDVTAGSGGMRQERLQWQVSSSAADSRSDMLEIGGRWCWQEGAQLADLAQQQFSWQDCSPEASDYEIRLAPSSAELKLQQAKKTNDVMAQNYYPQMMGDQHRRQEASSPAAPHPVVSSTSTPSFSTQNGKLISARVDKSDPRSRVHYVKYAKSHGRTTKLWECSICGREFQHQYTLMRHLPTHTDERNYHCSECGKSFRQLSTLSQHRAIHSAERPYSCELCKKTFNRVSTLISHRKTHSGNKPYKCSICPKGFYQKGNLRNHQFTHTNERPYRCNVCNKGFNQQSNLVCHKIKTHSYASSIESTQPSPIAPSTVRHTSVSFAPRPSTSSQQVCELTRTSSNQFEVSSSFDLDLDMEPTSTSKGDFSVHQFPDWLLGDAASDELEQKPVGMIVDQIKTYHMGVALATRQTPFALLRPEYGSPVLVKVVDTDLMGGKQLLVPVTSNDLRVGGKIVEQADKKPQIRVPVVATVVPRLQPSGEVVMAVREPHGAAAAARVKIEPPSLDCMATSEAYCSSETANVSCSSLERSVAFTSRSMDPVFGNLQGLSSVMKASPPPPPPAQLHSPCRGLDLFDPADCIPMGPQITSVGAAGSAPSDDHDIFVNFSDDQKLLKLGIHLSDAY